MAPDRLTNLEILDYQTQSLMPTMFSDIKDKLENFSRKVHTVLKDLKEKRIEILEQIS